MTLRALRRLGFPHKLGVLEHLFGGDLARHGVQWVETSAGTEWKLDLGNPTHRWMVYGDYEGPAFLNWARRTLPASGVVVDSGANIGQMAVFLAKCVPHGKVLAFEPFRDAADWLQECVDANHGTPIEVIRKGLGATAEHLFIKPLGPTHIHGAWNQISADEGQPVQIVRLDEELLERGVRAIDLWTLDVEGYEMQAIFGAEEMLRRRAIGALYVELAFGNGADIVAHLESLGYEGYLFDSGENLRELVVAALPSNTNGLFLPRPD